MTDIIAFQEGREARIDGKPRDGRRNADWLRGWDQVDDDFDRCPSPNSLPKRKVVRHG